MVCLFAFIYISCKTPEEGALVQVFLTNIIIPCPKFFYTRKVHFFGFYQWYYFGRVLLSEKNHDTNNGELGRSQVVRQRVLVPPSVGSNPTAPAKVLGPPAVLFFDPPPRTTPAILRLLIVIVSEKVSTIAIQIGASVKPSVDLRDNGLSFPCPSAVIYVRA
jgi:hypothetical protein